MQHGTGLIPHYCPTWTDMTFIKWSHFLVSGSFVNQSVEEGRPLHSSPHPLFIPSSAFSLLQSKRQVDPYEPSVIDAAPHTSQSGPWRSTAYAAAAVGNKADMGVMTWDKGQVMGSFQSGDHKKRSGLS